MQRMRKPNIRKSDIVRPGGRQRWRARVWWIMALLMFIGLAALSGECRAAPPAMGAAARSFPDTTDQIRVFVDQLPVQLTDAQARFVASHYAGSQKMPVSWTRRIRRLNPNFLMLHYQLAIGAGPAAFLVGEQWTNDFATVTTHEDWFLHDTQGHRLLQPAWNWYVMDIRFKNGLPVSGFPAYWLSSAVQRMRANEADGCFVDSYTQDILINQLKPSFDWFTNPDLTKQEWLPNLNQFGAYETDGFHRQPEHFYYLPNLGGLTTTWDTVTNLLVGDGGMNEGFCVPDPGHYLSLDDWKLAMTRILTLAAYNKIVLCQSYIDPASANDRWFIVGSYLLTKGAHSYLNMFHKNSLEWYPEYTLDLGAPRSGPRADVMTYWDPAWKVFRRDFTRGMALVNPGAEPVVVPDLAGTFDVVEAIGGGPVGADGVEPGTLKSHPVTSITIPSHSARILLMHPG
ncbi:MAG TPA: putative glycoside hydrolase [Armatimonadota bacterium]|nr:putative glycoside hydrolase [Armatimonadota bacterium]